MIDIHSHILPNVDDGSRSFRETLNMLQEAKEAGFTTVVSTSHYFLKHYEENEEDRKEILTEIKSKVTDIDICIGSEIFVTNSMPKLLLEHKASSINNTRYVLFELPFEHRTSNLKDIIYNLLGHEYIPIIAHPERYKFVQKDPNLLIDLIDLGVLFQCNFGSILGFYGKEPKRIVKKLLQNNFVHFLASDAHRQDNIYTLIPDCIEEISKFLPKEKIIELTQENPQKVLQNEKIQISRPIRIKKGFF